MSSRWKSSAPSLLCFPVGGFACSPILNEGENPCDRRLLGERGLDSEQALEMPGLPTASDRKDAEPSPNILDHLAASLVDRS